jgi:hypothetical protein
MNCIQANLSRTLGTALIILSAGLATCQTHPAAAPSALKIVDNPGGGQFAYGPLTGQSTKADGMVYLLHLAHTHFGDRPLVGKFFQSRDGSSVAAFFTLTAKTMGGQPITGLAIVSMPGKSAPQGAVLYDVRNRFLTSEPSMLKALSTAWQGMGSAPNAAEPSVQGRPAAGSGGGVEQLYPATAGDRSAVISLPEGWHITGVSGGQLAAEGSHGEMVGLGFLYQGIIDPRNPQSQSLGNFTRGPKVYCALTGDLFSNYVTVVNQVRRNAGKTQGTFNLISSTPLPAEGGAVRPIQAIFTVDFNDGIGPRKGSARIGVIRTPGLPTWAMTVSTSNIPLKYVDAETPTLMAVIKSYSQDAQVIGREGAADLARIHADGERARIQAKAADERREQSTQAYDSHMQDLNRNSSDFDQHMGNIDWSSKITQDYILDRSVVKDNDYDETATANNKFADSLVKANPNRFEIVQNQDLIRGRDY